MCTDDEKEFFRRQKLKEKHLKVLTEMLVDLSDNNYRICDLYDLADKHYQAVQSEMKNLTPIPVAG